MRWPTVYNALTVGGPLDNLSRNQMVARTPGGAFYLFPADGRGGFLPRVAVGGNSVLRSARFMG